VFAGRCGNCAALRQTNANGPLPDKNSQKSAKNKNSREKKFSKSDKNSQKSALVFFPYKTTMQRTGDDCFFIG
jgi:hypothetical protein